MKNDNEPRSLYFFLITKNSFGLPCFVALTCMLACSAYMHYGFFRRQLLNYVFSNIYHFHTYFFSDSHATESVQNRAKKVNLRLLKICEITMKSGPPQLARPPRPPRLARPPRLCLDFSEYKTAACR